DAKSSSYYVRAVRGGQCRLLGHLFIGSPGQATVWKIGDNMPIQWETQNILGTVTISLSRQGGKDGTFDIISTTENNGEFNWAVTSPISINCMLKITPASEPEKETVQGLFTIADTIPPILQPIAHQETFKTAPVCVTLTVSDTNGGPIFLSADASDDSLITSQQIQFDPSVIHTITPNTPQTIQATISPSLLTGTLTLAITAYDSGELSDTKSFTLNIKDTPNIPESERQFLIDLYHQTSPDVYASWKKAPIHTDGFSMPGTECAWEGITCYNGNYITGINLENKYLHGNIPDSISTLTQLKSLNLSQNYLTMIPESIESLTYLELLSLNNNDLSSSDIFQSIRQLTHLKYLDLSNARLSGTIPAIFENLTQLQYLNISTNQLQGKIFDILSNLTELQTLIIHHNNFDGQLPQNFNLLTNLTILDASANKFWGTIPSGIQNLSNLTQLIFSKNNLSGPFSTEIGGLTRLEILKLDRNQLTGELPENILNLTQLKDSLSDISYNALYSSNSHLKSFMDIKQTGGIWANTQTVPVNGISIEDGTETSITLSWAQVSADLPGGIEVSYAKMGESFVSIYPLHSKAKQQTTINGLLPGTHYQFKLRNYTEPHEENSNKVYSTDSAIITATTAGTTPNLDHYIKEGRQYLRNATLNSAILANKSFENALAIQSSHEESLLFHAITRFAPLLDIETNYTAGMPIENIKELLDVYGIDEQGRDINDWFADIQRDDQGNETVLDTSPSPAEIQKYIQSVWIAEIDASLNELSTLSDQFNLKLLKEDICDYCKEDIEIDYAEVLLIKSILNLTKTAAYMSISYDIDINVKEMLDKIAADIIDVHSDILDKYTTVFMLLADGQTYMNDNARSAFITAIDLYVEASDFIRSETDDQKDDLLSFDRGDQGLSSDEEKFRSFLEDLRQSLDQQVLLQVGTVDETWEMVNEKDQRLFLSLDRTSYGTFQGGTYVNKNMWIYGNNEFLGFSGDVTSFIEESNAVTLSLNAQNWQECYQDDNCYYNTTTCSGSGIFTGKLSSAKDSIYNGSYTIKDCEGTRTGTFKATRIDKTEKRYNANIGEFFADPISPREYFPDVKHDPYTNDIHINGISTIPDRTYSDVYPDRFPIDNNGAFLDKFYIHAISNPDELSKFSSYIDHYFLSHNLPESEFSDLPIADKLFMYDFIQYRYGYYWDFDFNYASYFNNAKNYYQNISDEQRERNEKLLSFIPLLKVSFYGLDLNDIVAVSVTAPLNRVEVSYFTAFFGGTKISIDMNQITISENSELIISHPLLLGEGKYTITLTDSNDNQYSQDRVLTYNALAPFNEQGLYPENNAIITIPQTLSWQPISDETINDLYYRVRIYLKDRNRFVPIHVFQRSTETSVIIPENILSSNTCYYWQVEAFDGSDDINSHNVVQSNIRAFYTGTDTIPLTLDSFTIQSNVLPDIDQTLITVHISNARPDDFMTVLISGPQHLTCSVADAKMLNNGGYQWAFDGILSNGNYRCTITDHRNNNIITRDTLFTFKRLPCADLLSSQKYIHTTVPRLQWTIHTDNTLYSSVELLDVIGNTLFTSTLSSALYVDIPANILQVNHQYQWQVHVYDTPTPGQNMSSTHLIPLFIQSIQPIIALNGPDAVVESNTVMNHAITLRLPVALPDSITILLTSSDTSEIRVPQSVIIPAGELSVSIDMTVVDDNEQDGVQIVSIHATANGWGDNSLIINVQDNDIAADHYITLGKQALSKRTHQSIVDSRGYFSTALTIDPTSEQANLFYAIARMAAIIDMNAPYTPGLPLESLNELLDACGVDPDGRDLFDWTADIYQASDDRLVLTDQCPSPQAVMNYLNTVFLAEIDGALNNLSNISESFVMIVTKEEMGTDSLDDVEVDYGEVLLYKSALYAIKSAILTLSCYDYDIQSVQALVDKITDEQFHINDDLLDRYTQLFTLLPGKANQISTDARQNILDAIDTYFSAYAFITSETDDQSNDLLSFEDEKSTYKTDEKAFRDMLTDLKSSIINNETVQIGERTSNWKITTSDNLGGTIYLDLTTDLHDNYQNAEWFASETNSTSPSYIGYGGTLAAYTQTTDSIQISIQNYFWNYSTHNLCEMNILIKGSFSLGYMSGTYTGMLCNESKSGTFNATLIDFTEETQHINAGEFYNDPISPRAYAPDVTQDPYTDNILVNGLRTFPDRTYSDIYPDQAPEDICIDHVAVYGVHSDSGSILLFSVRLNGLAPWMVREILVNYGQVTINQVPETFFLFPESQVYLQMEQMNTIDDTYHFDVQDTNGQLYSADKSFTFNVIPMATIISPEENAYLDSTTPTFSWQSVMDDKVGNHLYYKVVILDTMENTIYCSEAVSQNEFTLPQGILKENTSYIWQVVVMDGPDPVSMNNFSISSVKSFFTGESQPLVIEHASLETVVLSSGTSVSRLKLKLTGISKNDIQAVEMIGPETKTLYPLNSKNMADGSFYWDITLLSQGTYTIKITDSRDSSVVSIEKSVASTSLESPSGLEPLNLSIITTTMPVLSWEPVIGASCYNVQILGFNDHIVYESPVTTQTHILIPENILKEYETYQWRVQSLDSADLPQNSAQSETHEFYIARQNNRLAMSLPETVNENDGKVYAEISVPDRLDQALMVQLTIEPSGTLILSAPDVATIEANSKSIQIQLTLHDNTSIDGDQTIKIIANATGYISGSSEILVVDNDLPSGQSAPKVTTIPDQLVPKFQAFSAISLDNFVSDMDHDVSEIAWNIIGQSAISVSLNNRVAELSVSDINWTGTETLVFTAIDPDGLSSSVTALFTVTPVHLYLSMDTSFLENSGVARAAVYLNQPFSEDLRITLSSTDISEMTVPSAVTLPAGEYSVEFDCTIVNDTETDGTQSLTIQASASGWESAVQEITIQDDEISADTLIANGREALSLHTQDGINDARESFQNAVSKAPNNAEANFFLAGTRLLALLNTDTYVSGLPIDTLNELLDSYGISTTGRNLFNWTATFTKNLNGDIQLPEDSPLFQYVQKYLSDIVLPEIDAALANLSIISTTFTSILTDTETGDYLHGDVEVDYGDILAFRSSLHALKSAIHILCAYDLDADMDDILKKLDEKIFDINTDLFEKYQNFMNLFSDGSTVISNYATSELLQAIDLYFEASEYIRNETDDQENDLISIDPDAETDELEFRGDLAKIEDSLKQRVPVTIGKIETLIDESWEVEMQTTGSSNQQLYWSIFRDEFNHLKEAYYHFSYPCINGTSNGCHGDIFSYVVSNHILTLETASYDGVSMRFTGTLTADEMSILTGTFTATYYDGGEQNISGYFTASKIYSDIEVIDDSLTVNVGEFFDDPIDIRAYKPELASDPYSNGILIVSESSFPDRTFSGIFPEKWPTKGDIFIDEIRVWGSEYGLQLRLTLAGLAPWDIQEIYVEGPEGFYSFDMQNDPENSTDGLWYQIRILSLTTGNYAFQVIDKNGHSFEKDWHYTFNPITIDSAATIVPENGAFLNTSTPTFSLPAASSSIPVQLYYETCIRQSFDYFHGFQEIYCAFEKNSMVTIPEGILQMGKKYIWESYVDDADITNNYTTITEGRFFYTGEESDSVIVKNIVVRSQKSISGIQTIIDLDTAGGIENYAVSISGPITLSMDHAYTLPFTDERAYSIVSGIIPDGTYTFSIEKAGEITSYTVPYTYREIPVAQNLTVSNENGYVFTSMPAFTWSPATLQGTALHSNLQIYAYQETYGYAGDLIYESPITLDTQTTIPANVLKANHAYRYRVMVYDNPTNAENVSVTDFQYFYIKMSSPELMLTVPSKANEKDGTLVKQGKVSLNKIQLEDLAIGLLSSDTSEIVVPAQIIIPKGQTSVLFNIGVIDDDILDHSQTVIIKATAVGWTSASASITVLDDDTDWKTIDLPFMAEHIDFKAIWGTSADNIFVVGSPASIVHFDGYHWQPMSLPANLPDNCELFDIYGTDDKNIIAVGSHTSILTYDGSQWQSLTLNEYDGYPLYGVWVSGNDIHAVGEKYLSFEKGGWSERSENGAPFKSIWGTIETVSGSYTQTSLYVTGSSIIVKNFFPESIGQSIAYQSIFGITMDDIYAVGGNEILHKNQAWSVIDNPHRQSDDIYTSVWASAKNDILVAGINGTVLNKIDNQWTRMQTGTDKRLNDIWGSSEKDVYAVGEAGTILKARPRNVTINRSPKKPVAVTPVNEIILSSPEKIILESDTFSDPDGDRHQKTYWRVRRADQTYYRQDYTETFSTIVENMGTTLMTQHVIDAPMTGMKYYWQVGYVDDSDGQSDISWSEECSFKVGTLETDEHTPSIPPGDEMKDYKMVSFPYWAKNPHILDICSTTDGDLNTDANKIGTYLPSSGGYIEGVSVKIEPGRAYWFLSRNGLNLNLTGVKVNTTEIIELPLWYNVSTGNGWNMIGTPNEKTYAWESISIIVYDDMGNIMAGPYGVLSEDASEYIDSRLWEWEEGAYEENEEEIRPYEGYWVRVKHTNVSLQFPIDSLVKNTKRQSFVLKRWFQPFAQWLTPSPLQAVSSDEPPMPMGLNGAKASEDKCFIGVMQHGLCFWQLFAWGCLIVLVYHLRQKR
ncbi:MAG: hypothetical protein HQK75_08175, partial [Candidatus Magnetomorum sp.]|nr:hypothetical protein [Candidatus Magnetomorum sp.]